MGVVVVVVVVVLTVAKVLVVTVVVVCVCVLLMLAPGCSESLSFSFKLPHLLVNFKLPPCGERAFSDLRALQSQGLLAVKVVSVAEPARREVVIVHHGIMFHVTCPLDCFKIMEVGSEAEK